MSNVVNQKAGRKYSVDSGGITSLKKEYQVIQDAVMAANGEVVSFTGVPAIGSAHPSYPGLFVQSYDVQEGSGSDKQVLIVTVNYAPNTSEASGSGDAAFSVEEWGWDDGADEIELTSGQDGTPVVNSAGDPFESVPKVLAPAPVFTKVVKFKTRQTGWDSATCCVNSGAVTIGGKSFPVGSLLCTVCEKRIFGDPKWKYQYTIRLRYKSNCVKIAGSNAATDIGWDVAVADAGMRELVNNEKKLIRVLDKETGKMCTVTSATLLDGQGAKLAEGSDPYNFRFQAYGRASFPAWFYSEPS